VENKYAIVNGDFVKESEAKIHISDLSVQRGYGVFDFFKVIHNGFIFLEDHLDRFYFSAEKLRLNPGIGRSELKELVTELHERNGIPHAGIRITLTGGYAADGYTVTKPNLLITHAPLNIHSMYGASPIHLITYNHQRQMPEVKTIDYLMAIWLQPLVKENNAQDVLYHHNGILRECPRANFFIVTKDGIIATPKDHILKGITRKQIIANALANGYVVEERDITLEELYNAPEVFITSSTKNILPVVKIDGQQVGKGNIGPHTSKMREILNDTMR
jgi:branched-chain amino acid aminotransferase